MGACPVVARQGVARRALRRGVESLRAARLLGLIDLVAADAHEVEEAGEAVKAMGRADRLPNPSRVPTRS